MFSIIDFVVEIAIEDSFLLRGPIAGSLLLSVFRSVTWNDSYSSMPAWMLQSLKMSIRQSNPFSDRFLYSRQLLGNTSDFF